MGNDNKVTNFTAEQEESIDAGIESLFSVVGRQWGDGSTLGSFDAIDDSTRMAVLKRVYDVYDHRSRIERASLAAQTKAAIVNLVTEVRASLADAIGELEAMSSAARKIAGVSVPTDSRVPFAKFVALFPKGTPDKEILDTLHVNGLKMLAGQSKKGPLVIVPLKDAEPPKPPTASGSGLGK
jgi:hypothetical protein